MATVSAAGPAPEQAGSATDVRPSRLLRYRRWWNLRNEAITHGGSSCPERYDGSLGLASPPSVAGDLGVSPDPATAAAAATAAATTAPGDVDASGDLYQQTGTPLVQLMNGRWSGCLGPTLSNRSLSSRQGLRARASVLAASRYCPRPVAAAQMAAAGTGSSHSRTPSCLAAEASPVVAEVESDEDEELPAGIGKPLSPVSMPEAEPRAEPAAHGHPACGSWDCACCAGATAPGLPDSAAGRAILPAADAGRGSLDVDYEPAARQHQRRYQAFSEDYLPEDSAYAEYASESFATDSEHGFRRSGLAAQGSAMRMADAVDSGSAIMHEMSATQAGGAGAPNATAIAHIFLAGQPAQAQRGGRRVSRARRASRRVLLAMSRALRVGDRRLVLPALTADSRECSAALLASLSAEAALAGSIRVLEKTRTTRSPSFRMRADRVHVSQAQLLLCIYKLFTQLVAAEERRSRHYRFYLPEDDQMELDRGFSESVLFAAQALARGFQIRGTESHTDNLREPAWMLCSVWAAVRFVLYARGGALWDTWAHGRPHAAGAGADEPLPDEIAALRRVLEDFDEAWVRFERELCFAYFGLNNSQVAGLMEPGDSSDSGQIAQEEEFSLLVVLLSETLQRCLTQALVSDEQMEAMDPQLILALPRLAILHAIAGGDSGGVDGLCFVESEGCPVFWWFRDYADVCRQIHNVVSTLPPELYELLQKMLVAEEADVVLAQTKDAVLFEALYRDEPVRPVAPKALAKARSETVRDDASSAKRTAVVDLESIIDSPRSARSLSIDDCISSFCASAYLNSYESCVGHAGQSRGHASSVSCLACESSARLYATPGMFDVPPLPPHPSSTLLAASAELSASLVTSPSLQTTKCSLARALSPSLSMASTRSASGERQRRMRLDACRKQLKQTFVAVCTVADSLHSGPFARPFRVALELVFRMNATE